MAVSIKYDYNNALSHVVGGEHGLSTRELRRLQPVADEAHQQLRRLRKNGDIGFYDLADPNSAVQKKNLADCRRLGDEIAREFDNFVVLGIGGSALGPICVQRALGHTYYNLLDSVGRNGRPRIFVLDNPDPELLAPLLDVAHPARTCFNVITKSGTTSETMAQFMAFYDRVAAAVGEANAHKHFVLTMSPHQKAKVADRPEYYRNRQKLGRETLFIPDNVGGRFSELSPVGLLPAAVAGIDIEGLVRGAQAVAKRCESPKLMQNPAYLDGAIHYLACAEKGKTISVMMPYASALREVADWYCQLWAESLGKVKGQPPQVIHVGQTPVRALGTTDQHSQLQLYKEGPNDKIITFIGVERYRDEFKTGTGLNKDLSGMKHLSGRDVGELLSAEMLATEFSLKNAERPSVRLMMDTISAENVGGLLQFLMTQTAFAGMLFEIDPFNQPGVEESKVATHALMGRKTPGDPKTTSKLKRMAATLADYEKSRLKQRPIPLG